MLLNRFFYIASLVLFLLALAFVMSGCSRSRAESAKKDTASAANGQPPPIDVTVAQAVSRDLLRFFEAEGSFAGDEQTAVAPAGAGKVVSTGVDLASSVHKGKLLSHLD